MACRISAPAHSSDFFIQRRPAGPDHEKAVHEGIVDRPLKTMPLAQRAVVVGIGRLPMAIDLAEMSDPRAVGESASGFYFFSVNRHRRFGRELGRVMPRRHGHRQRGDVLRDHLGPKPISAEKIGINARLLPVPFQSVNLNPERAVVAECPGREAEP